MVQRLPLTQARNTLGAVVKRVHLNKEYVILEKDGIPLAGVMDIDEFEDYLELQDPKVRADVRRSTAEHRAADIEDRAMRQAADIRREADAYAYRVLQKLREQVAQVAQTVDRGLSELEGRGAPETVADSV